MILEVLQRYSGKFMPIIPQRLTKYFLVYLRQHSIQLPLHRLPQLCLLLGGNYLLGMLYLGGLPMLKLLQIFLVSSFFFLVQIVSSSFSFVGVKWTMYQSVSCTERKTPGWNLFGEFRWNGRSLKLHIMRSAQLVTALMMKFLRYVVWHSLV